MSIEIVKLQMKDKQNGYIFTGLLFIFYLCVFFYMAIPSKKYDGTIEYLTHSILSKFSDEN